MAKTEKKNEGDQRKEGKKNIPWDEDPEILLRLAKVADLLVQGLQVIEIAEKNRVSIATAKRDCARVREIWRESLKEQVKDAAAVAIAQYSGVIAKAWADIGKLKPVNTNRAALLNVIIRAQERIDRVSGITEKFEHSGPGGGPIPVDIVNLEEVRKKRWKSVAGALAELEQQQKTK